MRCLVDTGLCIVRGDAKAYLLTLKKSKTEALNLTDTVLTFTIKKNKSDADVDAVIQKQLAIKDAANGLAQLELTHEETDIELATYWYDIQLESEDNKPLTILRGTCKVTYDITRGMYG